MRRRQAGFTLTEMMVVVTIIGVLVTMAIVYMRGRVRPIDVANRVGDLMREASRRAVALGPVRANVAVRLKSKVRTQVTAAATTRTLPGLSRPVTTVTFTLSRLQEDTPDTTDTAQWIDVDHYTTDVNVDVESWAPGVADHTSSDLTSDWARWVLPGTGNSPPPIPMLRCWPDGTCDSCSIFFQAALPGPDCDPRQPAPVPLNEQCGKLTVMPLGGAITTRADWN